MPTTPTAMDERIPGIPGGVFDPSKPYQPPEVPSITTPPPNPLAQAPDKPAPSMWGGKGSTAAGIAYTLDSVLKGAMKGYQAKQEKTAYQANRLMQGYQYAYQSASSEYLSMLQSNDKLRENLTKLNDKNTTEEQRKQILSDPDVVKAQSLSAQADANRTAMYKIYRNTFAPKQKGKGKGKGGGGGGGDDQNPVLMAQSDDPATKLQGMLAVGERLPAAYKIQERYLLSPDYQKSRELMQGEQQITGDVQGKRIELHKLQNADPNTLNDRQKQRLAQLQDDPELFPQLARQTPHYGTFDTPGSALVDKTDPRTGLPLRDKYGNPFDPKKTYRQETIGGESTWIESAPKPSTLSKPGSEQAFIEQWAKENGIDDPKAIPAETQQQLHQAFRAPGGSTTIRNGKVVFTDAQGNSWQVPMTTTTTRTPSTTMPKAAPPKPPEWAPGAKLESTAGSTSTTQPSTSKQSPAAAPPAEGSLSSPIAGAKLMGQKGQTTDINAQNAMRDIAPVIDETISMLEPHKSEGGWTDAALSHMKYWAYAAGVSGSPLQDKIKQLEGFIGIAGAAPWSKVGRGKYIFEQAQVHLPKPTDSPELAYHKLNELKKIYDTELGSAAGRAKGVGGTAKTKEKKGGGTAGTFNWDDHPVVE